ncbi:MAG: S-layer homology domain-containing protein [Bacillota bacterium]|nr:S-layer homology domain-containing protein [Bacillota bacterium]
MKNMKRLLGLVMTLVMALSLVPAASAASMEPVNSIAITGLAKPIVGAVPDTEVAVSDGATVQNCYWWWDSDGNGAADEDHCTEFKEGGKYYCRIVLAPQGGYTFPSTQVLGRRGTLNKYTGTITVNGTAVTDAVYVADAGTMTFDWWKDAAESRYSWSSGNTTVVVQMPTITQQPQDAEIAKGGTATFTVAAQHTAELHYQWYFRPEDGTAEEVGEDSPTLTLDRYEAGSVYCEVSVTGASKTSNEAKLTLIPEYSMGNNWGTVTYAPSITKQPKDASVIKGGTATFTVEATGTAPLHYQWYGLVNTNGIVARLPQKVGIDSPKLTVTNAFSNYDKAVFYCVVSNDYGEAKSDAAQLVQLQEVPVKKEIKFADVAETAYYRAPVVWAVDRGVTNGTTDTTFSPTNTCTRAQIITFLWRASGSPEPTISCPFTDVPAGSYYEKATAWAAQMGMASGSTFGPNDPCTRLMAVEFMWIQSGKPGAPAASFEDVNSTAVNWAVEAGVTNGTSATKFSPDSTCTRGQIVTFLYRYLGD